MLGQQGIVILPDTPFANDRLARKRSAELLLRLVTTVDRPFSVGLAASWGSGKTTFLNLFCAYAKLQNSGFLICRFDAWRNEEIADPILVLSQELRSVVSKTFPTSAFTKLGKKVVDSGKKIVANATTTSLIVGSAVLPVLGVEHGPAIAAGAAGAAELAKHAAKAWPKAIAQKQAEATKTSDKDREAFRSVLSEAVDRVREEYIGDGCKILVLIDELDRCRPDFALRVFERIKHFFDVSGVVFVFAYDPKYVLSAAQAVYGSNFESERYFRRFVDLEIYLPVPAISDFVYENVQRLDFKSLPTLKGVPLKHYSELLAGIASSTSLTARDIQQYLAGLRLSLQTLEHQSVLSWMVPAITALRFVEPELYKTAVRDGGPFGPLLKKVAVMMAKTDQKTAVELFHFADGFVDLSRDGFYAKASASNYVTGDLQKIAQLKTIGEQTNLPGWIPEALADALRMFESHDAT